MVSKLNELKPLSLFRPTVRADISSLLTLGAKQPVPTAIAHALKRRRAPAVLTSRQRNAPIASLPIKAQLAATLARPIAVALLRIAALPADRHVAQVALPAGQALHVAIVVAHIVRVLVLRRRNLARLLLPLGHVALASGVHASSVHCQPEHGQPEQRRRHGGTATSGLHAETIAERKYTSCDELVKCSHLYSAHGCGSGRRWSV